MTELIDVGVKKDLVRAHVVLLKDCCESMVVVGEALGTPVVVDRSEGGRSRQNATRAAVADKARRGPARLDECDRGEERELEGRGVSLPQKSRLQQRRQAWLQTASASRIAR